MKMNKTTIDDFRKLEKTIVKEVFDKYIHPKFPTLSLKQFETNIKEPLRAKPKTQQEIIDTEYAELEEDENSVDRCHFIILDKNKMRRCKQSALEDDMYCRLHKDKDDTLAKPYLELKMRLDTSIPDTSIPDT